MKFETTTIELTELLSILGSLMYGWGAVFCPKLS